MVIKNVKDRPNYPGSGLLVTGLLISGRSICLYGENWEEGRNALNEKEWIIAALRLLKGSLFIINLISWFNYVGEKKIVIESCLYK